MVPEVKDVFTETIALFKGEIGARRVETVKGLGWRRREVTGSRRFRSGKVDLLKS